MKSLLQFLMFVVVVAVCLGAAVLWRRGGGPVEAPQPVAGVIEAADREFVALVSQVLPSVVSIDALPPEAVDPNAHLMKMLLGMRGGESPPQLGSGVVISEQGHIVTNFHVIQGAGAVRVHLSDGRVVPAKFVGGDRRSDIAILAIEADGLQPARWGDSDGVAVGQRVFAVGNPLGLQETVTQGIISAKGRRDMSEAANEFFQTDAAINQGNSGGPMFNLRGELIGITNMVAAGGEGVAFAIPSNTARRVYESIRDHGRFVRPWFGAVVEPLTPALARNLGIDGARGGAVLFGTYEGSPAAASGLRRGDVILEFNGKTIRDHIDLRNRVAECSPGQVATIRGIRNRSDFSTQTTVGAEPNP